MLITALSSPIALAVQQDFAQCQPSVLGPQKIQAQSQNLSDSERYAELEQLLVDFRAIRQAVDDKQRVPSGFLNNCFESKKQMVQQHYTKLSPTTQKSHRVLKVMAQILDASLESKDAVRFYAAAYETNPSDTESALRGLKMYAGIEYQNLIKNQKALTQEQKAEILASLLKQAYAIADNPKFTFNDRIWALDQVRGALVSAPLKPQIEEDYWKKYLSIDPTSETALRELMNVYKKRSDFVNMATYAVKLSAHPKVQASDIENIGLALYKTEDFSSLLKVGIDLTNKFATNAEAFGYLGIAEQKLELNDKAYAHLQKSLELKTTNPDVKSSYASLLEETADKDAENKKWISAMSKYREALAQNPNSTQLKKKTAYLLLDYYSDTQFLPKTAAEKDMDYALDLLKESLDSKVPLMADFAAGIRLGAHSTKPAQYTNLCDRYQVDRPSGLTMNIVQSCVSIYRAAGSEQKAKRIVDLAVSKMKDLPAKQELLKSAR